MLAQKPSLGIVGESATIGANWCLQEHITLSRRVSVWL